MAPNHQQGKPARARANIAVNSILFKRARKKTKKMPHFDHFPRPGEIDPYARRYDGQIIGNACT